MSNLCVEGGEHMFTIAICDDERQFRKRIHDILIEYMNEKVKSIFVCKFVSVKM